MSMNVDERVVQMYFDNEGFNDGISESMTLLEKFQNALTFRGASKGFGAVQMAANALNFTGIQNAVETIQMKFSAFEVIAITALSNITSRAMATGEAMVKSLSIDQITSGWSKYESMVENTQAIMSATDASMDTVQEKLDELNWFSDETSYSFSDMTSAVQKFTAAGVDLDKAVPAIEGIATWAAYSGVSARRAASAFYNMAQAIGKGMNRQDWASIELLNMNTPKFMQTAIDKGVELGKLIKSGIKDGQQLYKVVGATGKEAEAFDITQFRDMLHTGWFDQDTIIATLDAFGGYAHALYDTTDAYDTCAEAMEHFTWEHKDYGEAAFKAAQEAKTFTDAIEATKDAVSTGWMQTFKYIFGNYEEAKVLWTNVTEVLWDIFASSGEARNAILSDWYELGGRTDLIESIGNAWNFVSSAVTPVIEQFHEVFPRKTGEELYEMTKNLLKLTEALNITDEVSSSIEKTSNSVFTLVKSILDYFGSNAKNIFSNIIEPLKLIPPIIESLFPNGVMKYLQIYIDKFGELRKAIKQPWAMDTFEDGNYVAEVESFKMLVVKPWNSVQLEKIEEIFANIASFVNSALRWLPGVFDYVNDIAYTVSAAIEHVFPKEGFTFDDNFITTLLTDLSSLTQKLKDISLPKLKLNGNDRKAITSFVENIAGNIKEAIDIFKIIYDVAKQLGGIFWHTFIEIPAQVAKNVDFSHILDPFIKIKEAVDSLFDKAPVDKFLEKITDETGDFHWELKLPDLSVEQISSYYTFLESIMKIPSNIGETLGKIIELIGKAAEFTFSPDILDRIIELFGVFKDFKFPKFEFGLLSNESLSNIYNIFKGIFGILDIGIRVVTDFVEAFSPLISDIFGWLILKLPVANDAIDFSFGGIFELLGKAGRFISDLAVSLQTNDVIKTGFENIVNVIRVSYDVLKAIFSPLVNMIFEIIKSFTESGNIDFSSATSAITSFAAAIAEAVKSFLNIDTEKVLGFWDKLKGYGEKLGPFFSGIVRLLQGLWDMVSLIAPVFGWLANGIGEALSYLADSIGNFLDNVGLFDAAKGIWRFANGAALFSFAASFKKFVDTISEGVEVADALKDVPVLGSISKFMSLMSESIGESFKEILSPVTEVLSAMQDKLRGETLKEIAIAIGILAGSIFVLSIIPTTQLGLAIGTIAACASVLTYSLKSVVKSFKDTGLDIKMVASIGKLLILLATSVAILAGSMRLLSDIPWDGLLRGGIALVAIMAALSQMSKNLESQPKEIANTAKALLVISIGIRILAGAIKKISEIPWDRMIDSVGALLVMMWGLTKVATKLADSEHVDSMKKAGAGILLISIGVRILAGAVKSLSQLTWGGIGRGLAALAGILMELSAAVWFMTKVADIKQFGISVGLGLLLASAGIAIMAKSLKSFAESEPGDIGRGILALAGALTVLVIAMNFMPDNMLALGAGLMIASIGLMAMAAAIKIMQTDDMTKFGTGIASLVIGLIALTTCLHFLANPLTIAGAAALTIASVGMIALAVAIGILSAVGIPGVITGIVALAGTFMVLNIFAPGLIASAAGILALAGSLAALSGSAILGAIAIAACSAALYLLGATVGYIVGGIASSLDKAGDFIYRLFMGLATDSVDAMNDTLEINSPSKVFMRIGGFIIQGLIEGIGGAIPDLFSVFGSLGSGIIDFFGNALSGLFGGAGDDTGAASMGENIVNNMMSGVQNGAPNITSTMSDVMSQFNPTAYMPDMSQLGFDSTTMFGDGVFDASSHVNDAIANMGLSSNEVLAPYMDQLASAGGDGALNFADLMTQYTPNAEMAADGMGAYSVDALSAYTGQYSNEGASSGDNFASGLRSTSGRVSIASSTMDRKGVYAAQTILPQWYQVGSDSTIGFRNGLLSKASAVGEAAAYVASQALFSAKAAVESNSPSKKFMQLGEDSDTGLIIGLLNLSSDVRDAGEVIGKSALVGLEGIVDRAQSAVGEALEIAPTITPILDLTDVSRKASRINSMLPNSYAFDAFARVENRAAFDRITDTAIAATNQNGGTNGIIASLKEDIMSLGDRIERMQVVMDGNKLVGSISKRMDKSLGQQAAFKSRGI